MFSFLPSSILLTGGAGFIGSNLIYYLLDKYSDVCIINLDKLTYAGSLRNLSLLESQYKSAKGRYHFFHDDINNTDLVKDLLVKFKIDTIIHCAAETHVDRSIGSPQEFITTNVVGTFSVLEAARQVWLQQKNLTALDCRFHHISTDEVYGSLACDDSPATEHHPYQPNSPYAASKASSDHLVRAYANTYGLPVTLSHCSNNYGPNQHQEKLIPTIITACLQQNNIPIYGDGSNIRDWLYVVDHCRAIDYILRRGRVGQQYNIGANHELSNNQLVHYIIDYMEQHYPGINAYKNLITYVADRPGHDWRYALDSSLLTTTLAWQPQYSFQHGLAQTIQHYLV